MYNHSLQVSEFILLGLPETSESRTFHFIAFLFVYLMALSENLIIILVIIHSPHLHKPMYFFLANLALQDMGTISVIVPNSMVDSLLNMKAITYNGCFCQIFFFFIFSLSHFLLLGIMAYDRYVAICNPLQYENVMNMKTCIQMALSVWIAGLLYSTVYTGTAFTIEFCSNDIDQLFCEISKFYKIACSDSYLISYEVLCVEFSTGMIYFCFIVCSYIQIFRVVFRIPSTQGKQKALSTCVPHLIVIAIYIVSGSLAYLKPASPSLSIMDVFLSLFYCVLPPVMNPLIYSIRNKELKTAFWKLAADLFS